MHRQHPENLSLVAMPFIHTISLPCDGDLGAAGITSQYLLEVWRRGYSTPGGSPRRQGYRSQLIPAIDAVSKEEPSQYRPFILRTPVLASILLLTLALIGMIEFACRILPSSTSNSAQAASKHLLDVRSDNVREREFMTLVKDGADIVPTSKYLARTFTINLTIPASALSIDYLKLGMTSSMAQSSYLSLITTSDITPTTSVAATGITQDGYLSPNSKGIASASPSDCLVQTATVTLITTVTLPVLDGTMQDSHLSLTSKVTISASPPPSASLGLTATDGRVKSDCLFRTTTVTLLLTRTSILPGSTPSDNYLNRTFIIPQSSYSSLTTTSTTILATTSQGGYLSLSSKVTISTPLQSSSLGMAATKDQNSYLSLATASTILPSTTRQGYVHLTSTVITSSPSPAASATKSQYVDLTQTTAASIVTTTVITTSNTAAATLINPPTSTTAENTYLKPSSTLVSDSQTKNVPAPDPTSTASADGQRSGTVILVYPMYKYFAGAYLPIILAVLYRLLWTSVYATIKLMEPFHQLTQPDGALGKDSLTTYYQSSGFTPDPIRGYLRGHWAVLWASIVYLAADLTAPLASETLFTDTKSGCTGGTGANPCFPRLSVDRLVARLMQGLLGCVAALILAIIVILFRRRNPGLFADPSSIATMVSLLNHEHVVDDFQRLDPSATDDEMKKELKEKRYRLARYKAGNGTSRYGVVPVYDVQWANARNYIAVHQPNTRTRTRSYLRSTHFLVILRDSAFLLILIGILGLVVAYYMAAGDTPFNVFMNSQSFGPRFIMTAVASIIGSQWKRLEREIRIVAPYSALLSSPQDPRSTLLFRSTTLPITSFFNSLYHGHFFLTSIALVAILSEILVIMLAGVPFQSAQTWFAFLVSAYLSMTILGIMIMALIAIFWWRSSIKMPRMPDTLAAVWSYLCASFLLEDFEALEGLDEKERDKRIRSWGKRYDFGEKMCVDGVVRWAVDEDLGSATLGHQGVMEEG